MHAYSNEVIWLMACIVSLQLYLISTISQGESPITMLRLLPMFRSEPSRVTSVPPDRGPKLGIIGGLSSRGDCMCLCFRGRREGIRI